MSLRLRFLGFIGTVGFSVVFIHTTALLTSDARHLSQQWDETRHNQARHLAHACGELLINRDELAGINLMKELKRSPEILNAYCFDSAGTIVLHSDIDKTETKIPFSDVEQTGGSKRIDGNQWTYMASVQRNGRRWATAHLIVNGDEGRREVRRLVEDTLHRTLAPTLGVLALALVLSWLAAGALTRPILALEKGVRRVAEGDWATRVSSDAPGELGRLATQFNDMSRRLGELDRLKDQFVHTASHDLRNPLSAIATLTKSLKTRDLSADALPLVELIESSTVRLNVMVNNLLDLARLREGPLSLHRSSFEAGKLMGELFRLYEPLALESNKILTLSLSEPLWLQADEEKVMRIFLNLMSNALKFTRANDRIAISGAIGEPGFAVFQVSDTGWGIPPAQRERLFEPFHSIEGAPLETRQHQGTGLGLSITKTLVEAHGGHLSVQSDVQQGTTFTFTLPMSSRAVSESKTTAKGSFHEPPPPVN